MIKLSVSGLRGIVGKGLTHKEVLNYSLAYGLIHEGGKLAVGMDTRESGFALKSLVKGALMLCGSDVYDFGIIPTPAFLRMIKVLNLSGGIIITASHNPPQWNALKFAFGDRLSRNSEVEKVKDNLGKEPKYTAFGKEYRVEALNIYLTNFPKFDLSGLKVILDFQNGATSGWVDRVFEYLGAEIFTIRGSGKLPEDPEPKREKFAVMDELLREGYADVGFGFDPDGDRVICGLKGLGMLSEEQTTALALYSAAKTFNIPKKAVLNLSTSILSERVLADLGYEVLRWKVGEPNIIEYMENIGARLGGEGNGGLIYYDFSKGRDGILASVLIGKLVKEGDIPDLVLRNPYDMVKLKFSGKIEDILERLKGLVDGWDFVGIDGYYFRNGNNWVHIRPSNTEPVVRVIVEGDEWFVKNALKILQ